MVGCVVSELLDSTIVSAVDSTLKVISAALMCNCAMSAVIKSACDAMLSVCNGWSERAESLGLLSTEDIKPLADAMQPLLQTSKTAGENSQVTLASWYSPFIVK